MSRSLGLYWNTIRHLRSGQIFGRLWRKISHRFALPIGSAPVSGKPLGRFGVGNHFPWKDKSDISQGLFCFLNETANLGFPPDWTATEQPLLWQFNLHYFAYLHDLSDDTVVKLCHDWIDNNAIGQGVGWHPYTISLRLINWTRRCPPDEKISASIYQQATYLERNVERHIGGNHLLENARGLMHAAKYFEGSIPGSTWSAVALDMFREQIAEQILDDGGHYERSPMYHAIMLEGVLDVLSLLRGQSQDCKLLEASARKMLDFLVSMTHPDGNLVLANDSTQEIAYSTPSLVEYGKQVLGYEPRRRTTFPDSGYFVHQNDAAFICIDGGPIGPDHLPAHAHADIFSYELSVSGSQFIVDTGVFEYQSGEMREYVRGTAAHNTLQVDDLDQAECWSSFRVARRFKPYSISFNNSDEGFDFAGTFDGYGRLLGEQLTHVRSIKYRISDEHEIWVSDLVNGDKNHDLTSRLHLHPDVAVRQTEQNVVLERDDISLNFECDSLFRIVDSWYCPRFGMRLANKTIEIFAELDEEAELNYRLRF